MNPIHYNKIRRYLYHDETVSRVMPGNQKRDKPTPPKTYFTLQEYLIGGFTILTIFYLLYDQSSGARRLLMDEDNISNSFVWFWRNSLFGGVNPNYQHFWEATFMIILTFGMFIIVGFLLYKLAISMVKQVQTYTLYVQTDQRLMIVEKLHGKTPYKPIMRFADYGPGDIFDPHLIDLEGVWRHVIFSDRIEPGGAAQSDNMFVKRIGFYGISHAAELHEEIKLWMKQSTTGQVQLVHPELRFRITLPQSWSIKRTSYPEHGMDYTLLDVIAARIHQQDYVRRIPTNSKPWNTLLLTKRMPFEKEKLNNAIIYQTILVEVFSTADERTLVKKASDVVITTILPDERLPKTPALAGIIQRSVLVCSYDSLFRLNTATPHSKAKGKDLKNGCKSIYLESEFKFGTHNFHLYQAYSMKDDLHFRFTLHSPSPIDDKTVEAFNEIMGSLHFYKPEEDLPHPHFLREKQKRRLTFRDN
ncbi:MAG: hypothetical protein ACRBF0_13005 [Calditrichia bacterium]